MGFFTGWAEKIGTSLQGLFPGMTGILLSKADGSADLWQSNGSGAANVAITESALPSGAATAAGQGPWTVVCSTALEASHVIGAAPCSLKHLSGRIDSTHATATYYVLCLNAAALPADGAVTHLLAPIKVQHVNGSDSYWDFGIPDGGVAASAGVVVCISSTEFTKTIGGAFLSVDGVRS